MARSYVGGCSHSFLMASLFFMQVATCGTNRSSPAPLCGLLPAPTMALIRCVLLLRPILLSATYHTGRLFFCAPKSLTLCAFHAWVFMHCPLLLQYLENIVAHSAGHANNGQDITFRVARTVGGE